MQENPVARQADLDQAWKKLEDGTDLEALLRLIKQLDACAEFRWTLDLHGKQLRLTRAALRTVALELAHRVEEREKCGSPGKD